MGRAGASSEATSDGQRGCTRTRYVIDGPLQVPDRRMLNVRTAWFIDNEGDAPRFITTPLCGGEDDSGTGRRDLELRFAGAPP